MINLVGTKEEGTVFKPSKRLHLDCFVDTDHAVLCNCDPPDKTTSEKATATSIKLTRNCLHIDSINVIILAVGY